MADLTADSGSIKFQIKFNLNANSSAIFQKSTFLLENAKQFTSLLFADEIVLCKTAAESK